MGVIFSIIYLVMSIDRYLSPAANACYWRKILRSYAKLLSPEIFPLDLTRAIDFESFILTRTLDWEPH